MHGYFLFNCSHYLNIFVAVVFTMVGSNSSPIQYSTMSGYVIKFVCLESLHTTYQSTTHASEINVCPQSCIAPSAWTGDRYFVSWLQLLYWLYMERISLMLVTGLSGVHIHFIFPWQTCMWHEGVCFSHMKMHHFKHVGKVFSNSGYRCQYSHSATREFLSQKPYIKCTSASSTLLNLSILVVILVTSMSLVMVLHCILPWSLSPDPQSDDYNNTKWHHCKHVTLKWSKIWKLCLHFQLQLISPATTLLHLTLNHPAWASCKEGGHLGWERI